MVDAIKGTSLGVNLPDFLAHLPLSEQGLAWLVPSVATLAIAIGCDRLLGKPREALA
ncbi:Branched-chain amino acid transport system 2 carrier protein [compost metagenome]